MISQVLFFFFLLLKQFYFFPSGSVGFADICLTLCFLTLIYEALKHKGWQTTPTVFSGKDKIIYQGGNLYLFLFCVVIINAAYTLTQKNNDFIKYSLFWLYNGMAVWCFAKLGQKKGFEQCLSRGCRLNILIQTVILISGRGRLFYESWGGIRYMGTFNDPNQLAFYIFLMILLLYLCRETKSNADWIFYILAFIIISVSKSTGVFLGTIIFIAGIGIETTCQLYSGCKSRKMLYGLCWFGLAFICAAACLIVMPKNGFSVQAGQFTLLQRVQEKLWKIKENGAIELVYDRGWEKLFLYPRYVLYGAGEGGFERFAMARYINEIHSSLLSVLFCYGIIPTVLLLLWVKRQILQTERWMLAAILALFAESLFLVNYRQPLFWLVIMFGRICREKAIFAGTKTNSFFP